jgi:hypothetical protein
VGHIDKAHAAMQKAIRHAPHFVASALSGRSVFRRPEDRRKYHVFVQVAAGVMEPGAADALR